MLKIKRPKRNVIRTVVPPAEKINVRRAVEEIIGSPDPARSLAAIKPAKAFLTAKLNGVPTAEAKALAGISPTTNAATLFETGSTKLILEELLSSDPAFSDEGLKKRLKKFWNAKETEYIPTRRGVIKRKKDNWDVQKFAFTNVVELRGYKKREKDDNANVQATQVIFNVTAIPGATEPPIEVKEIPQ